MRFLFMLSMVLCSSLVLANAKPAMTYKELIAELETIAKEHLEPSEVLKQEFTALQQSHNLLAADQNFDDFVRFRLAFELARDSGLWQICCAVTDKQPNSDSIWQQWTQLAKPPYSKGDLSTTDIADCDELSALFAFFARGLGVKRAGQ